MSDESRKEVGLMGHGTWETTVYGRTFAEIERAAKDETEAFGLVTGELRYDIRPHTSRRTVDGKQRSIEYEATVHALILN